jgi:hypothetical protein
MEKKNMEQDVDWLASDWLTLTSWTLAAKPHVIQTPKTQPRNETPILKSEAKEAHLYKS